MQQINNNLRERVLSKNISDTFCKFFISVLEQARQYYAKGQARQVFIVIITRRCFVLFFAYDEMLCECIRDSAADIPDCWKGYDLKELANIFKTCVITDNAAWSMAYDMAFDYFKCLKENDSKENDSKESVFPHLIVVDELLFHGRALNGFLYGLEKRLLRGEHLYRELFATSTSANSSIQKEFLDKLSIRVAKGNVGSSVLLSRYQRILSRENPDFELPVESWRNYSIAYAQYVSICGINNTGFTLGISIPVQQDRPFVTNSDSQFIRVSTQLQNIEQDTWLFFYPSAAQPRIICTVRCKQSQAEEKKNLYVPYIILDHISWKQLVELHHQLLQEAQADGKNKVATFLGRLDAVLSAEENSKKFLLTPWLTQTTDLVLTSWLMKRFLREIKGASQDEIMTVWKDSIGWDQLLRSFRSYSLEGKELTETRTALEELWSWEPARALEEYLAVYAANARPISVDWMDLRPICGNTVATEDSLLVQCLEDTISKISLEAERNAFTLYGSGLPFSDEALSSWGDNHSIDTLLEKLHTQTEIYSSLLNQVNVYEVIAIITQAMDLGLLGMNTIFDRQPCTNRAHYDESPPELYTRQRAGEAALFLLPIRYRNLLPVLDEIQEKRKEDLDGAAFDLTRFIDSLVSGDSTKSIQIANDLSMPADQLKRSLCSAYEMLVLGGQKFKEWECNLHDRRLPIKTQNEVGEIDHRLRMYFLSVYRNP